MLAAVLVAVVFAPQSRALSDVTPGMFQKVSTGVAYIKTFNCAGRATGQGTGFLVGSSVVMTARHVLQGSCGARVTIAGRSYKGVRWVYWASGRSAGFSEDLATLKLNASVPGHVFRVRSSTPPAGTNLGMIGYPLGNRLSLNQGKIIWRGKRSGAPLLAVRMLGAEGASGSPFIDDQGRVVGILQIGLGAKDVLGQRTAGVLVGLDLVRWWGPRARLDLCRAYPKGGIAGCRSNDTPDPPDDEPSYSPPPAAPQTLSVTECWAAATDSFDPSAKIFSLGAIQQDLFFNVRYNRSSTAADTVVLSYRLIRPDGTVFSTDSFDNSGQRYQGAGVRYSLRGPADLAPQGGFWKAEGRLNNGPPCTYEFKVERLLNPLSLTPSRTQFDPYSTFSISVEWRLLQEIESTGTLALRLVAPNGSVAYTSMLYVSSFTTTGSALLLTPFCSRFSTVDTCQYGTYRVDVVRDGLVVGSVTLTGVSP